MPRGELATSASLVSNAVAALAPQVVALLLLSPAQFAVFSLLFVALGLVQSAQNSLVVDPWLRRDIHESVLPVMPVVWAAVVLAGVAASIPVALSFVEPTDFWLSAAGLLLAQTRNSLRLIAVASSWRAPLTSDCIFVVGLASVLAGTSWNGLTWSDLWLGIVLGSALGTAPWITHVRSAPLVPWRWFAERRRDIASLWLESTILDFGVAGPPLAFAKFMAPADFAVVRAATSALLPVRLILLPLRAKIAGQRPAALRSGPYLLWLVALSLVVGAGTMIGLLLVGSWSLAGGGVLPLLRSYALEVALMAALQLVGTTFYLASRVHCRPRRLLVTRLADTAQQIVVLATAFIVGGLSGAVWGYVVLSAVSVALWWLALGPGRRGGPHPLPQRT